MKDLKKSEKICISVKELSIITDNCYPCEDNDFGTCFYHIMNKNNHSTLHYRNIHTDNIATTSRKNDKCHWFKKLIQNIKVLSIQIYRWFKNKYGENHNDVINKVKNEMKHLNESWENVTKTLSPNNMYDTYDMNQLSHAWGLQQEIQNIEKYESRQGESVGNKQEKKSIELLKDIWLIGRIDGQNKTHVLEFKARKYKLFGHIKYYERCQCEAYHRIWGKPVKLIEFYNENMNIIDYISSDEYWDTIKKKVKEFVRLYRLVLSDNILVDKLHESFAKGYTTEFLKKLEQSHFKV